MHDVGIGSESDEEPASWVSMRMIRIEAVARMAPKLSNSNVTPTSFIAASSSALRSSPSFPFAVPFLTILPGGTGFPPPIRCKPAFSRSASVHDKMVARRESISKRLESARGVAMKDRRMLLTRRLDTLALRERDRSDIIHRGASSVGRSGR